MRFKVIVLYVVVLSFTLGCQKKESSKEVPTKPSIEVRVVHEPELNTYLGQMRKLFLTNNPKLSDGTPVDIKLVKRKSLLAAKEIAKGQLKTEAWISQSSSLVNFTNARLSNLGPKQVNCAQLFSTPVVIAVQDKSRPHFNEINQSFSWYELFQRNIKKQGADSVSESFFSYTHATPGSSETGLVSLMQLAYLSASAGESVLDLETLRSKRSLNRLKEYEKAAYTYGANEHVLLQSLENPYSKRLRFAVTTEQKLATYNLKHGEKRLIALYPSEGSYWQDYTICTSEADWVSPARKAGLKLWYDFLLSEKAQYEIKKRGYRPTAVKFEEIAPLSSEQGVNTSLPEKSFLPVPADVVEFLDSKWREIQRPAAFMIVFDTSGSMDFEYISPAQSQFRNLLAQFPKHHVTSIVRISTEPAVELEFSSDPSKVISHIDTLEGLGGSAVYDSIKKGVELISNQKWNDFRKTLFVYTDGDDKNSRMSLDSLIDYVNNKSSTYDLNLMILGIKREGAKYNDLKRLATSTNGFFYEKDPNNMASIFESLREALS